MVIVEVNRDLYDFAAVLDEHKWKEFLKQPSSDEAIRESKVFYCQLSDGRKVQKSGERIGYCICQIGFIGSHYPGWKRVAVQESWFRDWSPFNPYVVHY